MRATNRFDGFRDLSQFLVAASGLFVNFATVLKSPDVGELLYGLARTWRENTRVETNIFFLIVTVLLLFVAAQEEVQRGALHLRDRVKATEGNDGDGFRIGPGRGI